MPASQGTPQRPWRRRRPEQGLLHRILREHLATFLARAESSDGRGLPRLVRRELLRYLSCGVLAFGFACVHCSRCGRDDLVAFTVLVQRLLGHPRPLTTLSFTTSHESS